MTAQRKKNGPHFFFALTLPSKIQQQLVDWRAERFPADNGYPVAKQALHMVLAWLNQPSAAQVTRLTHQAQRIQQAPFTLNLNDAGYWPRSRQVWIGSQPAPRELLQLATLLRSRAAQAGCQQSSLPFHPHITLLRNLSLPVELPSRNFQWQIPIKEFALFSSSFDQGRVTMHCEARFPLLPSSERPV